MGKVLKQRSRLVNFRLTEEEYESFRATCTNIGARNMSDYARTILLNNVYLHSPERADIAAMAAATASHLNGADSNHLDERLLSLDQKVAQLEATLRQLAEAILPRLHNRAPAITTAAAPGGNGRSKP
jgi:hypothetical protein